VAAKEIDHPLRRPEFTREGDLLDRQLRIRQQHLRPLETPLDDFMRDRAFVMYGEAAF